MASRWRILLIVSLTIAHPKTVDVVAKATVVLHNFLRTVRKNDSLVNNAVEVDEQTGAVSSIHHICTYIMLVSQHFSHFRLLLEHGVGSKKR